MDNREKYISTTSGQAIMQLDSGISSLGSNECISYRMDNPIMIFDRNQGKSGIPNFSKILSDTPIKKLVDDVSQIKTSQHEMHSDIDRLSERIYSISRDLNTIRNLLQTAIETSLTMNNNPKIKTATTSNKIPVEALCDTESELNPDMDQTDELEDLEQNNLHPLENVSTEETENCDDTGLTNGTEEEEIMVDREREITQLRLPNSLMTSTTSGSDNTNDAELADSEDLSVRAIKTSCDLPSTNDGDLKNVSYLHDKDIEENTFSKTHQYSDEKYNSMDEMEKHKSNGSKNDFYSFHGGPNSESSSITNEMSTSVDHNYALPAESANQFNPPNTTTTSVERREKAKYTKCCKTHQYNRPATKDVRRKIEMFTRKGNSIKYDFRKDSHFWHPKSNFQKDYFESQKDNYMYGLKKQNFQGMFQKPSKSRSDLSNFITQSKRKPLITKRSKQKQRKRTKERTTPLAQHKREASGHIKQIPNKPSKRNSSLFREDRKYIDFSNRCRCIKKKRRPGTWNKTDIANCDGVKKSQRPLNCSKVVPTGLGLKYIFLLALSFLAVINVALASNTDENQKNQKCGAGTADGFIIQIDISLSELYCLIQNFTLSCWTFDIVALLQMICYGLFQLSMVHCDRYSIFFVINVVMFSTLTNLKKRNCAVTVVYKEKLVYKGFLNDEMKIKEILKQNFIIKADLPEGYFMRTDSLPVLYGSMTVSYLASKDNSRSLAIQIKDAV